MAVITRTPKKVALVHETKPHLRFYRANGAIEAGSPCYLMANGLIAPTNAGAAGTAAPFVGCALADVGPNDPITVVFDGSIEGYDLSALAYGAKVYLSNTAGALDTVAGTVETAVGVVLPLNDGNPGTKVLYIQARPF